LTSATLQPELKTKLPGFASYLFKDLEGVVDEVLRAVDLEELIVGLGEILPLAMTSSRTRTLCASRPSLEPGGVR
jgi:hypothetical protein